MSRVFFISDLHFGHKRIVDFGRQQGKVYRTGDDYLENMHNIIENWNNVITKRDTVWVLGDVAFSEEGFEALKELEGHKKLVRGNHDNYFTTEKWLEVFETVESLVNYKGYWLSHAPIHPDELRGKRNIHGHVHHNSIMDKYNGHPDYRYVNVCCEAIGETPIPFEAIKNGWYDENRRC